MASASAARRLGFHLPWRIAQHGFTTSVEPAVAAAAAPVVRRSSPLVAGTASSEDSLESAAQAQAPALAEENRHGAGGIAYKGPMAEDLEGGARHASAVGKMWSNIPVHVRASFQAPKRLEDAPRASSPQLIDNAVSQVKALVASTGLAPASWHPATALYYNGEIPLAPYQKGQTAAYNYSQVLVPREYAYRIPLDMYVDPVFQTGDAEQRARAKAHTLWPRVHGKTTLLLTFSGQPLSGLFTGLKQWLDLVGEEFLARKNTQLLKLHCEEGWLNRRTSVLTKFHLRRQVQDDELFTTFVYRGKWKWELVRALHLYDKHLPSLLLVDSLGYVRWHAVGLPSDEATAVFRSLSKRLATERKNFV